MDTEEAMSFAINALKTRRQSHDLNNHLRTERRRHSRKKYMDLRSPEIEPSLSGILLKATVAILVKMARRPC